jgi:hypothetical protein
VSLFLLSIAHSGERKTSIDREALKAIRKYEAELRKAYDAQKQDYENDKRAWEKARDEADKAHKGDRAAHKTALDQLGPAPKPPMVPMITCPEPTYEGLTKLYMTGRLSLGIFSDEGGQFISGHGMKDEGGAKIRTAAGLSDLWNGQDLKRVRSQDGSTVIPDCRLSMYLQAQPDVAAAWLSDSMLINQGILSRVLVCAPESAIGSRPWRDPRPDCRFTDYEDRINEIIRKETPVNDEGEVTRTLITISPDARRRWVAFYNDVEMASLHGEEFAPIAGFASKIAENVVRIAAVLTVIAGGETIQVFEMSDAILIGEHYLGEALRLFEANRINADLRLAQRVLEWARKQDDGKFSLPDLYQRGMNAIPDKAAASKMVGILEDHGWLEKLKDGAVINEKWRRDVWQLVPEGRNEEVNA